MKMIRSKNILLISVMIFSEIRWGLSQRMPLIPLTVLIKKWTTDKDISLKDYLTYAASQNWIDISKFSTEGDYLDSDEVYQALTDYLIDYLKKDTNFSKLLYKYMLQEAPFPEARSVWCCMNREFYQKMMAVTRHWPPAP